LIVVEDINITSLKDALENKEESYLFELNESFINKYSKGIKFYVDRLRSGATAGVRGKTDIKFRNPESGEYEYISGSNEIKLNYNDTLVGNPEGGEINIATAVFLAQAYAEFLKDKIRCKHWLPCKTLVGFDTRYFSREIAEMITRVLAGNGFFVFRNKDNKPSPTPVNSLLTYVLDCAGSLNVTASHNPADQNGVKPNNEKGHLDSDDDLELFLSFVEKLYSDGKGSGNIKIAPLGEKVSEIDFSEIYLKDFIEPMMNDGFLDLNHIHEAMDKGWGFVIDGIGGTGGPIMEEILNDLFGDSWKKSIHIINKEYDPKMLGIPKPDPTIPSVMEQSGLLKIISDNPNISAGGTGDNDWDRFTSAISIDEKDIPKAKKAGLYVPSGTSTPLAQFTADQMYTFFGEYQLRRIAQERYYQLKGQKIDMYDEKLDEAIKSKEINLSNCYIITTYPSSIQSDYLVKYYGAKLIYTSVGFKNIGITVAGELEEKIGKDKDFKPIYILGKEESGGNGFGFPKGAKIGPDGKYWLGAKDKDTSLNVLKLMETSADAFLREKTIVDLYSEMLERLGVLTFYERVDWYIRNKDTLKKDDNIKFDIAKKADDLEKPENAVIVAKLLGEELVDNAKGEEIPLSESYLWVKIVSQDTIFSDGTKISKGEPIFNRVYEGEEKKPAKIDGEWTFMPIRAMKYNLKSGRFFTIFHAGEGPKIVLYDKEDRPIYWTLLRPSGTEVGLVRHYNEIVCDKNDANPWLLAKYAKVFIDYFGVAEYYDGDTFLGQFNEKSLTRVLKEKYSSKKE